jgi:uncharacterized protein (TIGR03437 family)
MGGVEARVEFAGLAPGRTGVYRVIAQIPAGVPKGSAVPVQVRQRHAVSPLTTIAIR